MLNSHCCENIWAIKTAMEEMSTVTCAPGECWTCSGDLKHKKLTLEMNYTGTDPMHMWNVYTA